VRLPEQEVRAGPWQNATARRATMRTNTRMWLIAGLIGAVVSPGLAAQGNPPIQGTLALEGTMTRFYKGLNALVVTTVDGAEHVYHFAKGLVVHGGKDLGSGTLEALRPGTSVVVHYRIDGAEQAAEEIDDLAGEGLKVSEGVVVKLDRRHKQITLKLDNGRTETLLLTDRVVSETVDGIDDPGTVRVTVYYSDESGKKVAHFVKKTP
jgi:hypothetical protein